MKRQPTTQAVTWFLDMERNGQLDLNPPYQRKSVWTPKDRKFFLDTILRNYPAPPIFVHRTTDDQGRTTYHVVDGKQRLETILDFAKSKIALARDFGNTDIEGKKFKDIDTIYKRQFWDYILVVDFLDEVDGANIEQVFDRVNRNSRNLQPQELRHARFNGWFIEEAESFSEDAFWADIKVTTKAKEKRMKNTQFISELMAVVLENESVGFSQDYLNIIYAKYDDPYEEVVDSFDEDVYRAKIDRIVSILKVMESTNSCVTTYAKTVNNLYTLWSVVALTPDLPEPALLAANYKAFMQSVQAVKVDGTDPIDEDAADETVAEEDIAKTKGIDKRVLSYAQNSKGASTEPQQREKRFKALQNVLQK